MSDNEMQELLQSNAQSGEVLTTLREVEASPDEDNPSIVRLVVRSRHTPGPQIVRAEVVCKNTTVPYDGALLSFQAGRSFGDFPLNYPCLKRS